MSLTEDDFKALRLLIREEVRGEVQPFREEVNQRLRVIDERFDYLYKQDEKWEQEFLSIGNQLDRMEKKLDRHDQYFDDLDIRVGAIEKKRA